MNLFFDTSALVKLFHEEKGSEAVTNLITSQNNEIWISELVRIEFFSVLFRRLRNAEFLLKKYGKSKGLRTLDAIQLGTFSLISEEGWIFVAADELLCEIVRDIGYKTINPLKL